MNNWRKHRNFRSFENSDGTFTYIITIDGKKVEVSSEIYKAYAQGGYKMENMEFGLKCNRVLKDANGRTVRDEHGQSIMLPEREVSLDKLISDDWEFPSMSPSPEEMLLLMELSELENLHFCITLLSASEQALIKALYFENVTERKYAKMLGITQQSVNKRKRKALKKIKVIWERGC